MDELAPHGLSAQELADARVCLQCRVLTVPDGAGWTHPPALREKFEHTGICGTPQPGAVPKEREIRFGRGKQAGERRSIHGSLEVGYTPGAPIVIGTDGSYKVSTIGGQVRKMIGWGFISTTGAYAAGSSAPSTAVVGRERVLVGELRAVYWALKAVPEAKVEVLIDSAYAIRWLRRWAAGETAVPNGYSLDRAEGRTPRLMELAEMMREGRRRITLRWVPSHAGVPLNVGADTLARLCRDWSTGRITKQVLRTEVVTVAEDALTRHFADAARRPAG
jgi:ribonuclease HI